MDKKNNNNKVHSGLEGLPEVYYVSGNVKQNKPKQTERSWGGGCPAAKIDFSCLKGNDHYQTIEAKRKVKWKVIKKKICDVAEFFSYHQWPLSWKRLEMSKRSRNNFSGCGHRARRDEQQRPFLLGHHWCGFPSEMDARERFLSFQNRAKMMMDTTKGPTMASGLTKSKGRLLTTIGLCTE